MLLDPPDAERFLRVYKAALTQVATLEPKQVKDSISVRGLLYQSKYRQTPPTNDEDLTAALKTAVYGEFILGRHLARHTEMIGPKEKVYWVKGLTTELREITPPWVFIKTAVMQFRGHWICDGLIESHNLLLGSNLIREYTEIVREAKAKATAKAKAKPEPAARQAKPKTTRRTLSETRKDKVREERITMEIVVDAYDAQERAIGWHCYLSDNLRFPFKAKCIHVRRSSPLEEGDEVEVTGLAPSSECEREMFVEIRREKRNLAVPLSQLQAVGADEETEQAVADWHYWANRGYQF